MKVVRRGRPVGVVAALVVLVASAPLLFVLYSAMDVSLERWAGLWSARIPGLLWNTLSLAVGVSFFSLVLGLSSAWLIARRSFPGRRLAVWLMVLPLAVPTYVLAHVYITLLEPGGVLAEMWLGVSGGRLPVPQLHGLGGAVLC